MSLSAAVIQEITDLKNEILKTCATLPRIRPLQPDDEKIIHECCEALNKSTVNNEPSLFETPQWLDQTSNSLTWNTTRSNLAFLSDGIIRIKNVFNKEADRKIATQNADWMQAQAPDAIQQQKNLITLYSDYAERCDSIAQKILALPPSL